MTDSTYPSQTSNDELKAMLLALTDAQSKQRDTTVEILVRIKSQDERIASQANLLTNINQRLGEVERKTESTARAQEGLEVDVLREVSVQARKIDALAAETKEQSATLAKQDTALAKQDVLLAEIAGYKQQILLLIKLFKSLRLVVAGGATVITVVTWVVTHWK